MGTLYECLREARLEKYYPAFRANGITRSETLSRLSVHDCMVLGITSTDDRRRMIELINIIKSVHDESRTQSGSQQSSDTSTASRKTSYSRRRTRSPSSATGQNAAVRGFEATRDVTVTDRTPNFSASSYVDMLELLTDSSSEESADEAGHSDEQNIPRHVARSGPVSKHSQGQVERVKHTTGYNYGVPKNASKSKPKQTTSSSRGDDKIRVCVRKRPVTRREERSGDDDIVQTEGSNTAIVNEPKQAVDLTAFTLQHEFVFDEVFNENCSNEDVYVRAARPLINTIFNSGNATCFAYGQTGAGKTHTMMGNENVPGLYLLAAHDIYSIIQSKQYGDDLHVWVSFFEIYCGQLFDLLNRRNRLHAREDGAKKVCIAGLMETEAKDVQGLVKVLDYGNSVRSKGATGVNPDSSRSHAILQMEIRDDNDHKLGRISFIDLAGSERAADVTDTDRQTRLEGAEINQSLLALKECIRSIDQSSRHKPFRQSKLTHILKDSFIGNSRTCMIANISPTMSACENTLNTLRYADRVKELKRAGSRGTSSSQVENLLMNIPITAPSVFHPSNILSCSTPMRPVQRHTANRPSDDGHLDPSDTPLRGHFPHKKTRSQKSQSSTMPKSPHAGRVSAASVTRPSNPSQDTSHTREPVFRHNIPPPAVMQPQQTSSPSGSDQTESETCNLTLPRNSNLPQPNIPVVQSTDTEFDFPTSDFNVPEEMNDLNKTGEKTDKFQKCSAKGEPILDKSKDKDNSKPSGRMLPETPLRSVAARPQIYDSARPKDKDPERVQLVTKPIPRSNSPATRRPHSAAAAMSDMGAVGGAPPVPAVSAPAPYAGIPTLTTNVIESIEDDQLFDTPAQSGRPQIVARTDSVSITSPQAKNGLSKLNGSNQVNVIPAVMPASSSDLSFTQRAPMKAPAEMEGILLTPRVIDPTPQRQRLERQELMISDVSDIPQPDPVPDPPSLPHHLEGGPRLSSPNPEPPRYPQSRERRTRHASHSSQSSDDSLEGVRTSQSDSAQGPYRVRSKSKSKVSGLRKEKSDPIIALHMQTKKKTLPNPEEFHKYLSRGNTPKAGQTSSSPMPVPSSKSDMPPSEGSKNAPIFYIPSDSDYTESRSGRSSPASRMSPASKMVGHESQKSPVPSEKQAGGESKTNVKSKSRVSVASLLRSSSRGDRPSSPKVTPSTHSDSSHNKPTFAQAPAGGHSHALRLDNKENISISSRSDSSQQSSINSEILGKNIQTTSGSFVARNNDSPGGAKNSTAVIVTEKLTAGAVFSPIHPQPITSNAVIKTISPTSPASDVVQPKPVPLVSGSVTSSVATVRQSVAVAIPLDDKNDPRSQLVMSHEDQLASVTSLCKQEMKLLLSAKSGHRSFEDYMRKLSDILSHKMTVMQQLQDQITTYCTDHGIQRRSVSQSTSSCIRSHQHL